MTDARRSIPAVESLLASAEFRGLIERAGRDRVAAMIRAVQTQVREASARVDGGDGAGDPPAAPAWYARAVAARIDAADRRSLRRVINATGVVLHTNLGRAPLADAARGAVAEAAGYTTLEYDLATGSRGSRHDHCVSLLRELTGAEAALVVNNNAAAVVLVLNTLSAGAEAVVSRGELVEIGGSFRIPEIMAWSGALMREVGTTNRTHLGDYEQALGPDTGLLLKVHRSNFRIEGFTKEAGVAELAGLSSRSGVPLLHDLGSGAVLDLGELGLPLEPTARQTLEDGAQVVTMSGDKLLGGPQAGIILGKAELLDRMRRNPLLRAIRCDKLALAALEATLALYRNPDSARSQVPVLRMLAETPEHLAQRAAGMAARLGERGVIAVTAPGQSAVGGGAYPGVELATCLVVVLPGETGASELAARLRDGDPPVVARIAEDSLLLDPRTVLPQEDDALVAAVVAALSAPDPPDL